MLTITMFVITFIAFKYFTDKIKDLSRDISYLKCIGDNLYTSLSLQCLKDYVKSEEAKTGEMVFYINGIRGMDYVKNIARYHKEMSDKNTTLFNNYPYAIGVFKNEKGNIIFTPPLETSVSNLFSYYKEELENKKNKKSDEVRISDINNFNVPKEVSEAEYRMWLLNSLGEEHIDNLKTIFNSDFYQALRNISISGCKYDDSAKGLIVGKDIESYCLNTYNKKFSTLIKEFDEEYKRLLKK